MVATRFLSVFFISFLLLSPLIKQTQKLIEKPVIILGIDNSRSMVLAGDSAYYRKEFPEKLNALSEELREQCEIKTYSFGDNLKLGFDAAYPDKHTDISAFFNEITTRYINRNAVALIIATDGIYNKGTDPFYAAQKITFPVYTIALGDTSLKKDLIIQKVVVNKTAYKGDKFPVEVIVEMNKCAGSSSRVTLVNEKKTLETKTLRAIGNRSVQKAVFMLDAGEPGLYRYSLRLDELENEVSSQNNQADFYVEVLDTRQKIALVFNAPHPDITAIQKALKGSTHFETELVPVDSMPASFDKYDLVILNQLPSVNTVKNLDPIMKSRASVLFIIGSQTDINAFNNLKTGLIINTSKNAFSESQSIVNDAFSLFTVDKKDAAFFSEATPLQSPFGVYQYSPLSEVLFYQKIGNVTTQSPMILFTRASEKKIGVITGENIWRWRMYNFIRQSNHEAFDLLIDKMAQYLSTRDDKSFFRIRVNNKISENEPVEMDADVYNATYELINEPDVNITITDASGKTYPFVFSKTLKSYHLNTGLFPVGEYSYAANVKVGSSLYQKSGKFYIEQVNIESSNLVADHNLLFRIAMAHDGEMVLRDSIMTLAKRITSRQDIRSVSIFQKRMTGLIGNPWIFGLILFLLTAEWVIRKREGK